jgi:hypothetical protein
VSDSGNVITKPPNTQRRQFLGEEILPELPGQKWDLLDDCQADPSKAAITISMGSGAINKNIQIF